MLQGGDAEAHLLGDAEELENLVGPIAVRVDQSLALQDLDQRLELEVPPGSDEPFRAGALLLFVLLPFLLVGAGPRKGLPDDVDDPHPRLRVACGRALPSRTLRVLSHRELDPG